MFFFFVLFFFFVFFVLFFQIERHFSDVNKDLVQYNMTKYFIFWIKTFKHENKNTF